MRDAPESALERGGLYGRLLARLSDKHQREVVRFVKFGVVGTIGAVVDFGSFNIIDATGLLSPVNVRLIGGLNLTGTGIASAISFMLAVINNFLWNRYWTYPDSRSKALFSQLGVFFGINAFGLVVRVPILEGLRGPIARLLVGLLALRSDLATVIGKNVALALAMIVVLFWNFFVNRYITYNDVT